MKQVKVDPVRIHVVLGSKYWHVFE